VTDDVVAPRPGHGVSPSDEGAPSGSGATSPAPLPSTPPSPDAVALVSALTRTGRTMAVAESLTGGAVAAAVVDVPGASRVLRGAVVAYATDLKAALLGVDAALLERSGPVDPDVAAQMAVGVRTRLGADLGLATTGVAGPQDQDGHPPGEVHVAVAWVDGVRVRSLRLDGDRAAVRGEAGRVVLTLALEVADAPDPRGNTQVAERVG
jgi:nicotinamide-nucleotide amidase